jgi:hypothetical protein
VLPVGWLVLAVVLAVLLTSWITFTLTRLDRLHARCDAAQATLDAQLLRRSVALLQVAESPDSGVPDADRARLRGVAETALAARDEGPRRGGAENLVGRALHELPSLRPEAAAELREAAERVLIARRFYNDAVRDTRALRARRMPRMLRLAGHRELPQFFDIDDTIPEPPSPETVR